MDPALIRRRLAARRPRRMNEPGVQAAAVALILVPGPRGLEALFIRRARHPQDPWSGQVGLPGGRRDRGDATLYATAARETAEETGIRLRRPDLLGELDDLHPRTAALPAIVIRPFVFALPARPRLRPNPEVAYPFWLPLTALRPSRGHPVIRGRRLSVPCLRAGRRMIWGLTFRILTKVLSPVTVAS